MFARCIIACVVVLLVPTYVIHAELPLAPMYDVSSSFRSYFTVPPFGTIVVPTIVSVPVENLTFTRPDFLVRENETNEYIQSTFVSNAVTVSTPLTIMDVETGEYLPALADTDARTMSQFDVSGDTAAMTTFMMTHQQQITSTQLNLSLDRNVNLPDSVALRAVVNGTEQVVLATTRVTGTIISFPPTTASVWYVTLTYRQPLRLSKVSLQNESMDVAISKQLRFLAQPNRSYVVYFDADNAVPSVGRESGNLKSGAMVTTSPVTPPYVSFNSDYKMVDRDRDGIADVSDNCPAVANEDQADIDSSGKGDACEDFDRDGVSNAIDNCINLPNQDQFDIDGDALGDACDGAESRLTEKYQFIPWAALGLALVTIISMFAIVARRPLVVQTESTPEGE